MTSGKQSLTAPYYVRGLALGIPAYLIGIHLWSWILMSSFYLGGHSDFRQIYAAAYMVRTGHAAHLYDPVSQERAQNELVSPAQVMPFIRPAYELLAFLPLTWLRYRTAYFLLLGVNLVCLGLVYRLLRPRMTNLAAIYPWLPIALFLGFLPIAAALIQGQDSILFLLMLTSAFMLMEHEEELWCGVVVGLALFKFQVIIPLAIIFLLWRRWSFMKGFALSGLAVGGISLWITGLSQVQAYIRILWLVGTSFVGHGYPVVIQRMANLHGLTFGLLGHHVAASWIPTLTLLASVAVLALIARLKLENTRDALLLAIAASAVLSYHLFIHDLSIVLIPLVVSLDRFLHGEADGDSDARLRFRLAAFVFVSPLLISYTGEHFYLVAVPLITFVLVQARKSMPAHDSVPIEIPEAVKQPRVA
jgi:Glycosyltransferase family 87